MCKIFGIPELRKKAKDARAAERYAYIAVNAIGDACTGSNPRQPSVEEMEKLLDCVYYDLDVDF